MHFFIRVKAFCDRISVEIVFTNLLLPSGIMIFRTISSVLMRVVPIAVCIARSSPPVL